MGAKFYITYLIGETEFYKLFLISSKLTSHIEDMTSDFPEFFFF